MSIQIKTDYGINEASDSLDRAQEAERFLKGMAAKDFNLRDVQLRNGNDHFYFRNFEENSDTNEIIRLLNELLHRYAKLKREEMRAHIEFALTYEEPVAKPEAAE